MVAKINHTALYRLPWNYADNGVSWLEPTTACNMSCEGCYRNTHKAKHKTLEEVRSDLKVFKKLRTSDCMSICGGDPLVHPEIAEIVRMTKQMGWKPIINTNGLALTEEMLVTLKKVGVFGFTFHIDTSQKRPSVNAENEGELNDLRLHYARLLARTGTFACSFNSTVSEITVNHTASIVTWAQEHAPIVHTVVFIIYRSAVMAGEDLDVFANGQKVEHKAPYDETAWGGERMLYSEDIVDQVRKADPQYEPSAYLNGTADPSSLKWLLAIRVVFNKKVMGYVSPKFQELVQIIHHLLYGTYLSYSSPRFTRTGILTSFLMGFFDGKMRRIFFRILGEMIRNPLILFKPAHFQSIMIIQPINVKPDGRADMCDACPDITVHDGRLVWSCRLEEMNEYGCFFTFAPKQKAKMSQHHKEEKTKTSLPTVEPDCKASWARATSTKS